MGNIFCRLFGILLLLSAANSPAVTRFVDLNCSTPAPPYTDWTSAAINIQDAVDVSSPGDAVFVNDGNYTVGGRTVGTNMLLNRVVVDKVILVQSVNGPSFTTIQGSGPIGSNAVRCIYLTNGASLIGFTLTGGATGTNFHFYNDYTGGGAWCPSKTAVLSNCVFSSNSAPLIGSAVSGGTLNNCTLLCNSNRFNGAAAMSATLNNCTLSTNTGGAAWNCILTACTLAGNSSHDGGAAWGCTMTNCLLIGNNAMNGGAAGGSTMVGCTITGNSAEDGGGIYQGTLLVNCVISSNTASYGGGVYEGTLINCTIAGNIVNGGSFGGGVAQATLTNCILMGNSSGSGGGAYLSTLDHCTLFSNSASYGGGAYSTTLTSCTLSNNFAGYGGGTEGGTLTDCWLSSNSAAVGGGGVDSSTLTHCIITGNSAPSGGGASLGTLNYCMVDHNSASDGGGGSQTTFNNCIIYANSARSGGGASAGKLNSCTVTGNVATNYGGGVYNESTLTNCIIFGNLGPAWAQEYYLILDFDHCCTTPDPGVGIGNFTNAPKFVDLAGGNFHLQADSPCINAGKYSIASGSSDFDGNPRVIAGTIDIGAYEFQNPTSVISYQWLQRFNLPFDGTADSADLDGDGMNNSQEWRAHTDPTNALSVLKMIPSSPALGIQPQWQSVSGTKYFLQRATNISGISIFSSIASNIVGQADITSYTDTNAVGYGPFFYRVGVQ